MAKEYAKKFYNSKAWIDCKTAYIKSVFGLCERCGKPGYIVHHKKYITPQNINDPNITLNFDNLEYLCLDCHNKEHNFDRVKPKATRNDVMFDKNGQLVQSPPSIK